MLQRSSSSASPRLKVYLKLTTSVNTRYNKGREAIIEYKFIGGALGSGIVFLACVISASAAGPIFSRHEDKATIPGHKIEIARGQQMNVDCTVAAMPAFQIVTQPAHGRTSIAREGIYPGFQPGNPREKCNSRKRPALVMSYTPSGSFVGHDFLEVRIAYADGGINDIRIDIDIK